MVGLRDTETQVQISIDLYTGTIKWDEHVDIDWNRYVGISISLRVRVCSRY